MTGAAEILGKGQTSFPHYIALLELVSNDYPERCFNTGMSQNGIYTKRSGYLASMTRQELLMCALPALKDGDHFE